MALLGHHRQQSEVYRDQVGAESELISMVAVDS